ncbi:MAG: ABC transporter ATP-binding protein [Aerococcaceae bacterium]|nr:ABC transporter ATP-binding protein [Aerococcaceae bacterium]
MLEIKQLSQTFGKKHALKNVSFTVNRGEITCLIGTNGSGKTTIMNAIMQLFPVTKGEVLLDGKAIKHQDFERIIYIPDEVAVLKSWTIQEALDFMATFYKGYNARRAAELLEFFKLNRDDKIASLSKGTVAKVNLVMGLSVDCEYILMDEPFTGIDSLAREQIAQVFTTQLIEDRAVLISTHEVHEIEHLVDKVVHIQDGELLGEYDLELLRLNEGKGIADLLREASL